MLQDISWLGTYVTEHFQVVSCPARTCLLARNGLMNQVKFIGLLPNVVSTNEIVRLLISMQHIPYSNSILYLYSSIRTFFERVWCTMFGTLLGYTVAKVRQPKKFDLAHQTVSLHEREGGVGDEHKFQVRYLCYRIYFILCHQVGSYITSYVTCVSKDQACHGVYISPDKVPSLLSQAQLTLPHSMTE